VSVRSPPRTLLRAACPLTKPYSRLSSPVLSPRMCPSRVQSFGASTTFTTWAPRDTTTGVFSSKTASFLYRALLRPNLRYHVQWLGLRPLPSPPPTPHPPYCLLFNHRLAPFTPHSSLLSHVVFVRSMLHPTHAPPPPPPPHPSLPAFSTSPCWTRCSTRFWTRPPRTTQPACARHVCATAPVISAALLLPSLSSTALSVAPTTACFCLSLPASACLCLPAACCGLLPRSCTAACAAACTAACVLHAADRLLPLPPRCQDAKALNASQVTLASLDVEDLPEGVHASTLATASTAGTLVSALLFLNPGGGLNGKALSSLGTLAQQHSQPYAVTKGASAVFVRLAVVSGLVSGWLAIRSGAARLFACVCV
jgi:hypothetical protein